MIIHSTDTLVHDPPYGWDHGKGDTYMDSASRIKNILAALHQHSLDDMLIVPREFDMHPIAEVHSPELINFIQSSQDLAEDEAVYPYVFPYRKDICSPNTNLHKAGYYCFDVGTVMQRHTFRSAKAAVDTALEGAQQIIENKTAWAFALSRPPGHHADRDFYGGLCFFNNAAVAARHLSRHGPVALLDLDFHHGNGSQGIFYHDPDVLYVSIHGDPRAHFPFMTGHAFEIGAEPGEGLTVNFPLPADVNLKRYRSYLDRALQRIDDFGPTFLVVSMGFDTHVSDILSDALFKTEDFAIVGKTLRGTGYPMLVCLEGGYDLVTIGGNVCEFLRGLNIH